MSSVSFDGEVLRIKISGYGNQWNRDLAFVKALPDREFLAGSCVWVTPFSHDTINKLEKAGFTINLGKDQTSPGVKEDFDTTLSKFFKGETVVDSKLFPCQHKHAQQLIYDLVQCKGALDASDTGTGKTFTALAIAKYLNLFPIILTPKSVVPSWEKVAYKVFNIDCFALNYEQYKNNNTPYLFVDSIMVTDKNGEPKEEIRATWKLPKNAMLIFDEVHRCKNYKTINSKLLESARGTGNNVLCLSATIANDPLQMHSIGIVLGLFRDSSGFWGWARRHGVYKGKYGMEFDNSEENLKKIHSSIFPNHGSRLRTSAFGDLFPENRILAEPYSMGNADKIQELYTKMDWELSKLKDKKEKDTASILTQILRQRQEIELLKVPTIVELVEDHVEEGNSVAVFVNFRETVDALSYRLKTKCIIDGRIVGESREKNREAFQNDKQRVIICNTAAGGVGIGLHDINGKYPRIGLISPTYSPQDLLQVLGRLPRAGAKSKVLQKLIYCAGTREEEIAAKVSRKIANIKLINDGILTEEDLI
jgi:superfamily II DNA or RNA helicase